MTDNEILRILAESSIKQGRSLAIAPQAVIELLDEIGSLSSAVEHFLQVWDEKSFDIEEKIIALEQMREIHHPAQPKADDAEVG